MRCQGNCACCGGCGKSLELTRQEIERLQSFAQLPFQPVGRTADSEMPQSPGGGADSGLVLRLLEKKGLISLDYDKPLEGYSCEEYDQYPLRGSAALTARGQEALDWIEYQGILE